MKLTKPQIEDLFKFTRQHYVYWYYLQCELVDHLANDIEHIWEQQPNFTYEKARDLSFNKFGVFGFMEVIDKKTKSLNKRYFKLFWHEFKQFFTILKIILTMFFMFIIDWLLKLTAFNQYILITTLILLLIYPILLGVKEQKRITRQHKRTGKKYLFEMYLLNFGNLYVFFQILIQLTLGLRVNFIEQNQILISVLIVIFYLMLYITMVVIPPKIKEILIKENPEYQIID